MANVIHEMFAFVVEDPTTHDEGILGFLGGSEWVPMVGADLARVESLKPLADTITRSMGLTYRIKHFIYVDDL